MPIRDILQEKVTDIVAENETVLRTVASPVPEELFSTPELAGILKDMIDTLDQEPDGVALAAPQIGVPYRIFVVRYDRTLPPDPTPDNSSSEVAPPVTASTPRPADIGVFINPKFIRASRKRIEMEEGCLSVRGIYGTTLRHERATVQAHTEDGKKFERGGGGLLAQIFQHETDHLNGMLFTDHAIELVEVTKKEPGEPTAT